MTPRPHLAAPLLAAALCAGLASASPAQGGWRQWDLRLRDGRRVEANPLGAPDDAHLSTSVAAYDGRERPLPRSRVRLLAAQATPFDSLPPAPRGETCEDAIIRRDGSRTTGRVTLLRVRWSEGVVKQRGVEVDLRDVAYIAFGAPGGRRRCRSG